MMTKQLNNENPIRNRKKPNRIFCYSNPQGGFDNRISRLNWSDHGGSRLISVRP